MGTIEQSFSGVLSGLRRRRGLNQRTVAADLSISQALLSHYENGAREPGLSFVNRACDYYGVSADYMLGRTDSELPTQSPVGEELASASARLFCAIRPYESEELISTVERYLTAAALKMMGRITSPGQGGWDCALDAEMAVCELLAVDTANRLRSPDGENKNSADREAHDAVEEIMAKVLTGLR